MKPHSQYLTAAIECTKEGIDHSLARRRSQDRSEATILFDRIIELLMRERLRQLGDNGHEAGGFWKVFTALESRGAPLNKDFIEDLHERRNILQHEGATIPPEQFDVTKKDAFELLGQLYEDILGLDLTTMFERHYLLVLKARGILRPVDEVQCLLIAARQSSDRNPELSVELAQQALADSIRLRGRLVGVDDAGLDFGDWEQYRDYVERWKDHCDLNDLDPDDYPGHLLDYLAERGDNWRQIDQEFDELFQPYASLADDVDKFEECMRDLRSAARYGLKNVKKRQGDEERFWQEQLESKEEAILEEIERLSPETAIVLEFAREDLRWDMSIGGLHILLYELNSNGLLSFESFLDLAKKPSVPEGFAKESIKAAIHKVLPEFPEYYLITTSIPSWLANIPDFDDFPDLASLLAEDP